jgi:glycosyltransferase involved in cell wall biosynthesis
LLVKKHKNITYSNFIVNSPKDKNPDMSSPKTEIRKIKVCHIITKLELGGAQQVALDTLKFLDSDQFEKYLITNNEGLLVSEAQNIPDLEIYFVPALVREINLLNDIKAYFRIKNILKRISPHIVHTHSSKAGILGRVAAKKVGVPYILHTYHGFSFHDFQSPLKKMIYIILERYAAKLSTHLFAVSKVNVEKGIKTKIFKEGSCSLTRDAIHTNIFKREISDSESVKKKFLILPNCKIVGMIACFKPQKSPFDFIYIAKKISNVRKDIRFFLVGDGILRERLEKLISVLKLEGIITLTGWRDDIPIIIKSFDVLVLTSLHEGLPMVVPQALASMVPVVVTNVDGALDIIEDGVNGFLVKPKDIETFCSKILKLIANPKLSEDFVKKGLSIVDEFDIHKMVQAQSDFYKYLHK